MKVPQEQLTPGANGKCLDEQIVNAWGSCRICRKFGHFAANCPKRSSRKSNYAVAERSGNSLCVGASVRACYLATSDARYRKRKQYYHGKIQKVHESGHVDILYDDDDEEERVAPEYVELLASVAPDVEAIRAARLARFDSPAAAPAPADDSDTCCICMEFPKTHAFVDSREVDLGCRHVVACFKCCNVTMKEEPSETGGWPCPYCCTEFTQVRRRSEVENCRIVSLE